MSLAPRNAPCPCGSGRKFKKCCGTDPASEEALEDRLEVQISLSLLALLSPKAIPVGDPFGEWVEAYLAGETGVTPREAIALLAETERERLLDVLEDLISPALAEVLGELPPEEVNGALLLGAVGAGIGDRKYGLPTGEVLELIAGGGDPHDLALALSGESLWEDEDGRAADRELALIPDWVDDDAYEARFEAALHTVADRLWTPWHEERLALLVGRITEQLPAKGFRAASAALATGCARYGSDAEFRAELAAELLADVLPRPSLGGLAELLAA